MCKAFGQFYKNKNYEDVLLTIRSKYSSTSTQWGEEPKTFEDVLQFISINDHQSLTCQSNFFRKLLASFKANTWVDIEREYFGNLKLEFSSSASEDKKKEAVRKLNSEFSFLIASLADYIQTVNDEINNISKLKVGNLKYNLHKAFKRIEKSEVRFLNFNYTETLFGKGYTEKENIIHIHGRVADIENNPIIFGYGDEADPVYQSIEDSGENIYLEHIKSFGYFRTGNYHKLLSYIDSAPYVVYIVGHSCGLSDRILLNQIFEHNNCKKIEIFYHQRKDATDNFKEITQEISRHFKPQNKGLMRRKIVDWNHRNIIPQNT